MTNDKEQLNTCKNALKLKRSSCTTASPHIDDRRVRPLSEDEIIALRKKNADLLAYAKEMLSDE